MVDVFSTPLQFWCEANKLLLASFVIQKASQNELLTALVEFSHYSLLVMCLPETR